MELNRLVFLTFTEGAGDLAINPNSIDLVVDYGTTRGVMIHGQHHEVNEEFIEIMKRIKEAKLGKSPAKMLTSPDPLERKLGELLSLDQVG